MRPITKEGGARLDKGKTEIMKCSKVLRGWGHSLDEHAVMHISVYTEAFNRLHPQDRISKQIQKQEKKIKKHYCNIGQNEVYKATQDRASAFCI